METGTNAAEDAAEDVAEEQTEEPVEEQSGQPAEEQEEPAAEDEDEGGPAGTRNGSIESPADESISDGDMDEDIWEDAVQEEIPVPEELEQSEAMYSEADAAGGDSAEIGSWAELKQMINECEVGGTITSTKVNQGQGARIGGGCDAAPGTITIGGGNITTIGGYGAGIGGGKSNTEGGKVTINGGVIDASGSYGIGSGESGSSVATTLGYTAAERDAISITASSYAGTVTLKQPFTNGSKDLGPGAVTDFILLNDHTLTAWIPVVIIEGVTGSFNDKIKLNYYFSIPQILLSDQNAYVTLTNESTGNSNTLNIKKAEFVEGKGYKFSILLAAKEARDTITAKVFDGQGGAAVIRGNLRDNDYTDTGVQSTLMQYLDWLAANGETDKEKALGTAAKDYCTAAQIYFNYHADDLAVSSEVGSVTEEMLSSYASGRSGTLPSGVSIRGISAMLESDNTLRLYLGFKDVKPSSFTYMIGGQSAELKTRSDGACYLALDTGVYSNHLQDTNFYSISDGTNTYTLTMSVLTYARSCAIKSEETVSNLGKALYLYNKAASALFAN